MSNKRAEAASKRRLFQAKAKVTKSGAKAKAPSTAKVTSSARRGARSKASNAKVSQSGGKGSGTAKVTASGGGSARTPGGPNKADAGSWKKANQSAKTSGKGPVKGAPGTSGAPTNATPNKQAHYYEPSRKPSSKIVADNAAKLKKAAMQRSAAGAGKAAGKAGAIGAAAAAGLNAGRVADGTMKGKPTGAKQGPPAPKAKDFGSAFKAARAAGKKEFTWKGKRYHTRRADGK